MPTKNEFFQKIKNLPKKYYVIAIIILAVIGFFIFRGNGDDKQRASMVERGNIVQEVSVTGKVQPANKVDLAFESTGKVAGIYKEVGETVYSGQMLASLNNAQYQAQYAQAKAGLEVEQSTLDELLKGIRSEELAIQVVKVQNAEQSLVDAKDGLVDKIWDAFTKSDDAVRNRADQLFNNPRSTNPDLTFSTDFVVEIETETKRLAIGEVLNDWSSELISLNTDSDLDNYYNSAKNKLNELNSFLNILSFAVNGMSADATFSQTTIDGYKTDIATARTNVNTAITNLSTADEKLRTAEATLLLEKQNLALKEAGATPEQIKTQEAKVKSAQANVNNYGALIAKTIIYSPINGIVTKVDVERGEIIQLNTPVISVISGAEFEIEANIPEADIAKVKLEDIAQVTLDAYGDDDIFAVKIISIEPAETIVEGVSTYKTIFQFEDKSELIRSGMTANIDIITENKKDVIFVSYRVLQTDSEGNRFVEVTEDEEVVKKIVQTGIRGTDGKIEILSGLNEGDEIIVK